MCTQRTRFVIKKSIGQGKCSWSGTRCISANWSIELYPSLKRNGGFTLGARLLTRASIPTNGLLIINYQTHGSIRLLLLLPYRPCWLYFHVHTLALIVASSLLEIVLRFARSYSHFIDLFTRSFVSISDNSSRHLRGKAGVYYDIDRYNLIRDV